MLLFRLNILAQAAALSAIDDAGFLKRSKKTILAGKRYLYKELKKLGFEYVPSVANFILVDVKKDARIVFSKLLRQGVIVRNMKAYKLKNFIRITIGTRKENQRLINALKEVK